MLRRAAVRVAVLLLLSFTLVALLNVPLLTPAGALAVSHAMSNDSDVVHWLHRLSWILVVHTQTRIIDLTLASFLAPMGWARVRVGVSFFSFVALAAPVATVGTLTDVWTTDLAVKLQLCVACTAIGQASNAVLFGVVLLCVIDWSVAAKTVAGRANTDLAPSEGGVSSVEAGGGVEPLVVTSSTSNGAGAAEHEGVREVRERRHTVQ
jgi:hypothetical protein